MHGNTRVKVLGTTIYFEALSTFRAYYRHSGSFESAYDKAMFNNKPNTIGAMIEEYIDSLSDEQYKRFRREVEKPA